MYYVSIMTFILSDVSQLGIVMASDSAATNKDPKTNKTISIDKRNKTIYLSEFNVGLSFWGDVGIPNVVFIPDWIKGRIEEYKQNLNNKTNLLNQHTEKLANYTRDELNKFFELPNNDTYRKLSLGIHLGGYIKNSNKLVPAIFHIHKTVDNELNMDEFQISPHIWNEINGQAFHVRNGMYKEFSIFWDAFNGVDKSFISMLQYNHKNHIKDCRDHIKLRAEWVANWVKLMCNSMKQAYLPEVIGKKVNVLVIQEKGNRNFEIPEFKEINY